MKYLTASFVMSFTLQQGLRAVCAYAEGKLGEWVLGARHAPAVLHWLAPQDLCRCEASYTCTCCDRCTLLFWIDLQLSLSFRAAYTRAYSVVPVWQALIAVQGQQPTATSTILQECV